MNVNGKALFSNANLRVWGHYVTQSGWDMATRGSCGEGKVDPLRSLSSRKLRLLRVWWSVTPPRHKE
jgi:hypothetical protein